MLGQDHFYYNLTKKYIVMFSQYIDDIRVERITKLGSLIKQIKVPISYSSKKKLFSYILRGTGSGDTEKISTFLPRIGFNITSMIPDRTRAENPLNENYISDDGSIENFIYSGVPYNFSINLSLWTKTFDDAYQIIEQLVTFFQPDYTVSVKEIEEYGITRNVSVSLEGFTPNNETELDETSMRLISYDFQFILKGHLYPASSTNKLITLVTLNQIEKDTLQKLSTIEHEDDGEGGITTTKTVYD